MVKDKVRLIKYLRLKPEERFLFDIIDGIEIYEQDKFPNSVFWKKDGIILFEQDFTNGWLRCNYKLIWNVLQKKYGYSFNDTKNFISRIIKNDIRLNGVIVYGYTPLHELDEIKILLQPNTFAFSYQSKHDPNVEKNFLSPKIIQQNRIDKIERIINNEQNR